MPILVSVFSPDILTLTYD